MEKRAPQLCGESECTGCMACANSCNRNAISIIQDSEGFYRPLVNNDQCVECGLCEKNCPVITPSSITHHPLKVYAAWHLDEEVRMNSSSGGAFSAMAESVIEEGGVVVGASYTDGIKIQHCIVERKEDLGKLRLSKYAQSEIGLVFKEIKDKLKQGRKVLFCGTPCQAAALKKMLVKDHEQLIVCDFICHGTPSIKMLQKWTHWIEQKYGSVAHINFRSKIKGWYDALRVITLRNGKKVILRGRKDAYWIGFNSNNSMQESCYNCKFVGIQRHSDITIADFWGVGKQISFGHKDEIEKGISCIIANTDKGIDLVKVSSNKMFLAERTLDEVFVGNQSMLKPCKRPASRDTIYADVDKLSYEDFRLKYLNPSFKNKLVKLWREYVPFFIIKPIRIRKQK